MRGHGKLIFEPIRELSKNDLHFSIGIDTTSVVSFGEYATTAQEEFEIHFINNTSRVLNDITLTCFWYRSNVDHLVTLRLYNPNFLINLDAAVSTQAEQAVADEEFDEFICTATPYILQATEGMTETGIPWIRNHYGQKLDKRNNILLPKKYQD